MQFIARLGQTAEQLIADDLLKPESIERFSEWDETFDACPEKGLLLVFNVDTHALTSVQIELFDTWKDGDVYRSPMPKGFMNPASKADIRNHLGNPDIEKAPVEVPVLGWTGGADFYKPGFSPDIPDCFLRVLYTTDGKVKALIFDSEEQ